MEQIVLYSILIGVIFIALGSIVPTYAATFTLIDEASCIALGGVWAIPVCSFTTSDLILPASDTIIVSPGITLALGDGINLISKGTITNNGIITLTDGDIRSRDSAVFANPGKIIFTGVSGINTDRIINRGSSTFTNSGIIMITGASDNTSRIVNRDTAVFSNSGTITITGGSNNDMGQLVNIDTASFTNSGKITITGTSENSGRLVNNDGASFTNFGTITITGTSENSGRLANIDTASFTNSGTITITGTSVKSGRLVNSDTATFSNSGKITIIGASENSGRLVNVDDASFKNCIKTGEISFSIFIGNAIEQVNCTIGGSSSSHEDPTIGKTRSGLQVVENGICIDITCWTVTADFHQEFELVEMFSDSTHTISTTVYCQRGVDKCNYVAFGVSPYGTNINDSVWKIILQKDHTDKWTMTVIDPDGYLGDITSTTQIINDEKHLAASITTLFKEPTPGMILNVEVRDSYGGYRDFKFNDGIAIKDTYAYPSIVPSYEAPIEVKPLCLNENPNKRYTCAFDLVREWTIKNAEKALT